MTITTQMSDQMIRERIGTTWLAPRMLASASLTRRHSLKAYRGLVPMSPKTTPRAATTAAAVKGRTGGEGGVSEPAGACSWAVLLM